MATVSHPPKAQAFTIHVYVASREQSLQECGRICYRQIGYDKRNEDSNPSPCADRIRRSRSLFCKKAIIIQDSDDIELFEVAIFGLAQHYHRTVAGRRDGRVHRVGRYW